MTIRPLMMIHQSLAAVSSKRVLADGQAMAFCAQIVRFASAVRTWCIEHRCYNGRAALRNKFPV